MTRENGTDTGLHTGFRDITPTMENPIEQKVGNGIKSSIKERSGKENGERHGNWDSIGGFRV